LRGRGGAGFPTAQKWQTLAKHPCSTRYVVCNAAEGEPGTFKDRYLIRKNPYAVIEGLIIAARTIQAQAAYIAIKHSFEIEIDRLKSALAEMKDVIGNLPITLVEGPEEYLFGEEKALLNVIENEGPFPRPADQPPYEVGLFATPASPNPALVNNVETLAHVATIFRHGAVSFRSLGTSDTPGTLLFTLSGDLQRPGVYECEAGLPLVKLLYDIGGGPHRGRFFKAVLAGISSAVILPSQFDVRTDFESMNIIGSSLGSAGFIAIDDLTPMPQVTQAIARFLNVESCDQCSACENGLRLAFESIDRMIKTSSPTAEDFENALTGARTAPQANRCYLPIQGSILIPSLLRAFQHEFDQLSKRRVAAPPWLLPKMTDYEESVGLFTYDLRQALKQPDWSYQDDSDSDDRTYKPTKSASDAGDSHRHH
jgi:NADH-quinone oxidoreductase subunit F